ncbi:unnamed protein product [Peronospora belbahrii]|uniref:Uncharacterized protein n=1 Tax=Peronospora belbahrii TaxID=622444 RepID=A0ABN8CMR7_9STRA|nr:unnamed protein product [Peronospora belbahrii]
MIRGREINRKQEIGIRMKKNENFLVQITSFSACAAQEKEVSRHVDLLLLYTGFPAARADMERQPLSQSIYSSHALLTMVKRRWALSIVAPFEASIVAAWGMM